MHRPLITHMTRQATAAVSAAIIKQSGVVDVAAVVLPMRGRDSDRSSSRNVDQPSQLSPGQPGRYELRWQQRLRP